MSLKQAILLRESSGILMLAVCVLLAIVNSGLFAVAIRLPVPPISAGGLFLNSLTTIVGWLAFVWGERPGIIRPTVAIILLVLINFYFISNLAAVLWFGL